MNIMDITTRDTSKMLDVSMLDESQAYLKRAFVVHASHGVTRTEKPFLRFNFRDCNGRLIQGRFFKVENLQECMYIAKQMLNKVCTVQFEVKTFEGDLTLDLMKIDVDSENLFEPKDFAGVVDNLAEVMETLTSRISLIDVPEFKMLREAIQTNNLLTKIKYSYNDKYGYKCGSAVNFIVIADEAASAVLGMYERDLALLLNTIVVSLDTMFDVGNDDFTMGEGQNTALAVCSKIMDSVRVSVKTILSEQLAKNIVDECNNILLGSFIDSKKYHTRLGILLEKINDLTATNIKLEDKLSRMLVNSSVIYETTTLHKMR